MATNYNTIAKVLQRQSPEAYRQAQKACEPLVCNTELIPKMHAAIRSAYPELDRTDESILFAAVVYTAYSPASLIASGIQRCPNGVRQQMCAVMQWNDAPVVNYYVSISQAYLKNPKFKERVSAVLLGFEQFSVKSAQGELF